MKRSEKIEAEALAKVDYECRVRDEAKFRRLREHYERCRIEFIAALDEVAKRDEA